MELTFKNYRKMKISTLLSISLIDKNESKIPRPGDTTDCFLINLELKKYQDLYGFKYIYPSNHIKDSSRFKINKELIKVVHYNYFINPDCYQKNEIPLTTWCQFGYTKGLTSERLFITATISVSVLSGTIGSLTFWVHNPKDGGIKRIEDPNQSILSTNYSTKDMCSIINTIYSN